jgi:hypothetical protein
VLGKIWHELPLPSPLVIGPLVFFLISVVSLWYAFFAAAVGIALSSLLLVNLNRHQICWVYLWLVFFLLFFPFCASFPLSIPLRSALELIVVLLSLSPPPLLSAVLPSLLAALFPPLLLLLLVPYF